MVVLGTLIYKDSTDIVNIGELGKLAHVRSYHEHEHQKLCMGCVPT